MAVVNYTSVTLQPPPQMSSIATLQVGTEIVDANADGTFTVAPADSSWVAARAGQGWLITSFTK